MPPNPRLRAQRAISELSVLSTAPPPSDGAWSPSSPAATPVISAESAAGSLAAPEAANNLKAAERPEKHTAAEGSGHSAAEAADVEPAAAAAAGAAGSSPEPDVPEAVRKLEAEARQEQNRVLVSTTPALNAIG